MQPGTRVRDALMGVGVVMGRQLYTDLYQVRFDAYDAYDGPADYHLRSPRDLQVAPTLHVFKAEGAIEVGGPVATRSALRYNEGKPELAYLLTYGPHVTSCIFYDHYSITIQELQKWYTGGRTTISEVFHTFQAEAPKNWPELLAETNQIGAKKYAVGNYLLGANWTQYVSAFLRHTRRLDAGEAKDSEGNPHDGAVGFNMSMLHLCVTTNLGVDDRIRPPST